MTGAPRRDRERREVPVVCDCGFTLGWLVRLQTELAIVRNPRVRLRLLLFDDRRWEIRCPSCGAQWPGPGGGHGGALLVA
jgi:hypothetical protein